MMIGNATPASVAGTVNRYWRSTPSTRTTVMFCVVATAGAVQALATVHRIPIGLDRCAIAAKATAERSTSTSSTTQATRIACTRGM